MTTETLKNDSNIMSPLYYLRKNAYSFPTLKTDDSFKVHSELARSSNKVYKRKMKLFNYEKLQWNFHNV